MNRILLIVGVVFLIAMSGCGANEDSQFRNIAGKQPIFTVTPGAGPREAGKQFAKQIFELTERVPTTANYPWDRIKSQPVGSNRFLIVGTVETSARAYDWEVLIEDSDGRWHCRKAEFDAKLVWWGD